MSQLNFSSSTTKIFPGFYPNSRFRGGQGSSASVKLIMFGSVSGFLTVVTFDRLNLIKFECTLWMGTCWGNVKFMCDEGTTGISLTMLKSFSEIMLPRVSRAKFDWSLFI